MFIYYNNNPNGIEEEDCVCRAISLALNKDYAYIDYLLESNAILNHCNKLNKLCYCNILENKFGLKSKNGNGLTVNQISKLHNKSLIIRIDGHLTCSKNGNIYDIWNCCNEIVDTYWINE